MTYTVSLTFPGKYTYTMNTYVKQERHDEAEIQELAAKMMEAHRAKMQAMGRPPQPPPQNPSYHNNMNILNFLTRTKKMDNSNAAPPVIHQEPAQNLGDEESISGHFGWTIIGKEHIPYIIRSEEHYCAVRMVETRVLNKYLTFLHPDICNCTCIRSYYITEAESRLLNEINIKHCDYLFGRDQFTCRDLIVRLSDAIEFHLFLDSCYTKLLNGSNSTVDRCGFIRINKESVVPYTIYNKQKYVPLFYFEGETDNLKLKADKLEGWDLAYLKFCCKVQGIRNELFAHDSCSVIGVSDIKHYFPIGTLFENYWPSKVVDSQLLINGKAPPQAGQWTRQPAGAPPSTQTPKSIMKTTNNTQLQNVPHTYANISNYGMPSAPANYPPLPVPRGPNTAIRSGYAARSVRPSFYTMAPAPPQPPPPLIRATQGPPTYTNTPNAVSSNYLMLGDTTIGRGPTSIGPGPTTIGPGVTTIGPGPGPTTIGPTAYRSIAPQMSKYPPPLIPVRHLNGEVRYEAPQNHYQPNDIVDLSGPNRTLPPHPQSAHEQPPQSQDEHQNMSNGQPTLNSIQRKLIPIADTPTSGNHIPYKMHKAFIESRMIPCINMKPFVYTELLVTIPDLIEQLFNNVPVQSCQQVMQVLGIELYKGNKSQMRVLYDNGKCQSINECVPLVPVRLVLEFMPQLKYMLGGLMSSDVVAKRPCTS